jgi:transcriptional regulator with XRE-family HTH domain
MEGRRRTIEGIIGERIRARRTALGLVQEQVAAALGLSYQQLQKYENGSNRITVDRLLALAHRLEVPITYFFAGLPGATAAPDDGRGEADIPRPTRAGQEAVRGLDRIRDEGVRGALASLVRTVVERQG